MTIPSQVQDILDQLGPVDPAQAGIFVLGIAGTGVEIAQLYEGGCLAHARDRAAALAAANIRLVEHINRG